MVAGRVVPIRVGCVTSGIRLQQRLHRVVPPLHASTAPTQAAARPTRSNQTRSAPAIAPTGARLHLRPVLLGRSEQQPVRERCTSQPTKRRSARRRPRTARRNAVRTVRLQHRLELGLHTLQPRPRRAAIPAQRKQLEPCQQTTAKHHRGAASSRRQEQPDTPAAAAPWLQTPPAEPHGSCGSHCPLRGPALRGDNSHAAHLHSSDVGAPILGNMKCRFPAAVLGVHVRALLEQRLHALRVALPR